MPSRNTIKTYTEGGVYHVYNRGVNRGLIFNDEKDYVVFLSYLKAALSSNEKPDNSSSSLPGMVRVRRLNLSTEVDLYAYCLMPNHFHLLLRQQKIDSMPRLMQSVMTAYAMYFNRRYDRVGPLFQGRYKASPVDTESYLLHISRYIHLNSLDLDIPHDLYDYSSFKYYAGRAKADWIKPDPILSFFKKESYEQFVKDYIHPKMTLNKLKDDIKTELKI